MSAQKLAALNTFRAAEGKAPYAAWKAARHQSQLDAYQNAKVFADVQGATQMRQMNDVLSVDIKETRAAWKASGTNMSKKHYALGMLEKGASIKDLSEKMGITETAARSLIGDVRRMGIVVTMERGVYTAIVKQEMEEEGEE